MGIYTIFFLFLCFIFIYKFNSFIKEEYYKNHELLTISDNYKKNNKDPFY